MVTIAATPVFFRLARLVAPFTVMAGALLSGCIHLPYPGPLPDDSLLEDSTLDFFVGATYQDVRLHLGDPDSMLALPDDEHFYLVYRELGSWGAYVGGFLIGIPGEGGVGAGWAGAGKDNWPFCYLLEFDERGYLLRYQTESYKDFENRRMPGCREILYFANVLPVSPRTLSEKDIEEKLGIVQSPQATPSTLGDAEFGAGTSAQPLAVVILPPGRGGRANGSPYSCCWEDDLLHRLSEVIDKDDTLVLVDSPNSTPHISPEVYNNPTKYWFGTAIKKPVISISSYATQKSDAEIAVLLFWEYRGDTIDFSLYVFDARTRRIHLKSGNRQSLKDVELQFRDLLREMHDAPLTAPYTLYGQLSLESKLFTEAWRSLCSAANQGNSEAQSEVAHWHLPYIWQNSSDRLPRLNDVGVVPDEHIAYMWFTLAGSNGDPIAMKRRRYIASMTSTDIAKAEQMARDWKPGDCPSAEHRLGVPVDVAQSGSPNTAVALATGAGMLAGSKSPSDKRHDTTQPQPTGPITVGILPPAFFNPISPSTSHNEEVIYGEVRRFVQSKQSVTLSYDYAARYGIGPSDTHAVWQGTVVKKMPDKAKMRAIGEDLGVEVLVLAWIKGMWARTEIDLYVFDVASGKMYQSSSNLDQARQLIESTFALANLPAEGKTVLQ